jgi:hypothetical protein
LSGATGSFSGSVTATSGKIGGFNVYYAMGQPFRLEGEDDAFIRMNDTYDESGQKYPFCSWLRCDTIEIEDRRYSSTRTTFKVYGRAHGNDYANSYVIITPLSTVQYGLYVAGKARINTTDYGSDEKTKKDFQDVSTLDKLKKLRVCAWRFDEEKLVEKDNEFIDAENIKIEAENKAIEAENIEIDKQNLLLMAKKSKSTEEEIKLIERKPLKKLREHRTADKNANHPLNIGCMAGEFNKAFGTNNGSEDCLSVTDTIGVCMRAIQELAAEVDELKAKLKIQQDEKSDVEQEASYTEKPNNSKDADNLEFPDVGKNGENQQQVCF